MSNYWKNWLKAAGIRAIIGVVLYFVVCRKLLMKNGEYVERWPKYLDLEDYLYRPLLLTVIPGICVFFCRIADRLIDSIVVLLRKSIFKDAKIPTEPSEGDDLTHALGGWIDDMIRGLNDGYLSYHPIAPEVEHKMALRRRYRLENKSIISRSMSYGLFLACIGLLLVMIYLLFL